MHFRYQVIIIAFVALSIILSVAFYNLFLKYTIIDLQNIPKGELAKEVVSPNGDYTFKAYLVNGGATVDYAIRGEVNYNRLNKKPKNIYWDYHQSSASIEWVDNEKVRINGYALNVLTDEYDFRVKKTK